MSHTIKRIARGNTDRVNFYTGPSGELVMDTQAKELVLQDGVTRGGIRLKTYSNATETFAGLMSSDDKIKLNSLLSYSLVTTSSDGLMSFNDKVKLDSITTVSHDNDGLMRKEDKIKLDSISKVSSKSDGLMTKADKIKLDSIIAYTVASTVADGLMSKEDKQKLNSLVLYTTASTYYDGLMSATDKAKLDNIKLVSAQNNGLMYSSDKIKLDNIKLVSYNNDGLMSKEDKIKLDGIKLVSTSNSGLMSYTDKNKLDSIKLVSYTNDGLMYRTDKKKLDNIEENANNYVLPTATANRLGGITVGSNLSITPAGVLSVPNASTIVSGVMSSADKVKLDLLNIDSLDRLSALCFSGSYVGTDDYISNRSAFQSAAYDSTNDILYCSRNLSPGVALCAIKWSTLKHLKQSPVSNSTAFYKYFAHQGLQFYGLDGSAAQLLSVGSKEVAYNDKTGNAVIDESNYNNLYLVSWDYTDPDKYSLKNTWIIWDTWLDGSSSGQLIDGHNVDFGFTNLAISEDREYVYFFKAFSFTDNDSGLSTSGLSFFRVALNSLNTIDSNIPICRFADISYTFYNKIPMFGQSVAVDSKYIYLLGSHANATNHVITVIDIYSKNIVYCRPGSFEGRNLFYSDAYNVSGIIEGEVLSFLPINGKYHLCMCVSVNWARKSDGKLFRKPVFYDLETPAGPLYNENLISDFNLGATHTTDDLLDCILPGGFYLNSGFCTDLSGGAWSFYNYVHENVPVMQLLYRVNNPRDLRIRVGKSSVKSTDSTEPEDRSITYWNRFVITDKDNNLDRIITQQTTGSNFHKLALRSGTSDEIPDSIAGIRLTTKGYYIISNRNFINLFVGFNPSGPQDTDAEETANTYKFYSAGVSVGAIVSNVVTGASSITGTFFKPLRNVSPAMTLGTEDSRWQSLYLVVASSILSDVRKKANIKDVDEKLMRAWGKVRFVLFQRKDALLQEYSTARVHVGVVAQEVESAFASEGLDAHDYSLFCYDKWEAQPAEYDDDSKEISPEIPAGDSYSIRYEEALALECAYQRWLGEQRDARIAALEAQLNK